MGLHFLKSIPEWKQKLIGHVVAIWLLLIAHAAFLGWSRQYDPTISSFWGAYGFDVLNTATDCSLLRQQQSAWALAVNILATLITYVSSDILLALSAPSRSQLDACHVERRYMEVGVHSFHNIRSPHFGWSKRILWGLLTLLILPFHLIYNSVIIVSQPASESYQITIPDSIIPFANKAAISQSLFDPTATASPLAVSVAATLSDTAIALTTDSSGATITAAPPVAASTSPSSCTGPTGSQVSVQTAIPQATMQPRLDPNCNEFAVAPCGMGCEDFASSAGIPFLDLLKWNMDVNVTTGDACLGFYGGYAYCVGVSGGSERRRTIARQLERLQQRTAPINELGLAASTELLNTWSSFSNWQSSYATSPYLAWIVNPKVDARNPTEWPGLSAAADDLDDLLGVAYSNSTSQSVWDSLTIASSDWIKSNLSDCRQSFSERYRPNTGTVVLVMSGLQTSETVVGLSYLSYNWTDLIASCPTSFLQNTPHGSDVIISENPPVLPLMFGPFGSRSDYAGNKLHWNNEGSVCPETYPGVDNYKPQSQPKVEGCLWKSRTSECRIGVNILFSVILLVALTIKAICMTAALFVLEEKPLLCVGDAMAEYLENPDHSTAGCSLSWTERDGWTLVNGAIMSYQHGRGYDYIDDADAIRRRDGYFLWLMAWPARQWRKIRPSKNMGRDEAVPKADILNNLHSMRSLDSLVWFWFYFCTLCVCFGIFYSINSQDGWIVLPDASSDLNWMLWPTILCNLPQLFATIRGFVDTWILTSRSSLEEFASYAKNRKGLRVSDPIEKTAQYPAYFFGGMNAVVFMTATGLQTFYAWIISEYAQPQWVNPLLPSDAPDVFSPAFLMKIGAQSNRTTAGKVCFCILIALFPFLAVYIVNMIQSLVVRVRVLHINQLSTFIPQYIADVLLLRWMSGFGRPEKTAELIPMVPLQMPGPATNSLVIALACQPKATERKAGLSTKPLRWGVVRRPHQPSATPDMVTDEKAAAQNAITAVNSPSCPGYGVPPRPVRSHSSRAPPSFKSQSTEDAALSPTMHGAPHLSGDEAAFATAWFDLTGVPQDDADQIHRFGDDSRDEEKGYGAKDTAVTTTMTRNTVETVATSSSDEGWESGHCAFSADEVAELEPGRLYTGIRRGEGHLSWAGQAEELLHRLFRSSSRPVRQVTTPGAHGETMMVKETSRWS